MLKSEANLIKSLVYYLLNRNQQLEKRLRTMEKRVTLEMRYNENHDPDDGKFTSGPSGSSGARSKSSKRRKQLKVSKQEYAVISDSISRNYDARFKKHAGKGTCHVQSANYDYTIRIGDRHNFTIVRRKRIR